MALQGREKAGRNDPCPCGSGKKYKQCCLQVAVAAEESPWSLQRAAADRLTGELLVFARRKHGEAIRDAWEDFNQTPVPPPYEKNPDEGQIFMPYFLFEWDPERPASRRRVSHRAGVVARTYLDKTAGALGEMEALVLEQATTQPLSFYEVLGVEPGESVLLRDILIGGETKVLERSASRSLQTGDIAYAQLWHFPQVATLGRLATIPMPPRYKAEVVGLRAKLRKKIARQERVLAAADLVRYAETVRTLYLEIRDAIRRPPQFCNTDGDPLLFHKLTFRVGSAQAAFDALAPMAWGQSREELLEEAEVTADGIFLGLDFDWRKPGNKKFQTWENTILGRLSISGRTLTAEVNSTARAAKLREEIERRLGILAVHQGTVSQTPEKMLEDGKRLKKSGPAAEEESDLPLDPLVREQVEAQVREQLESWVHQKLPALGGRSPIDAAGDPDGREAVEGLLLDWERSSEQPAGPGVIRPDIGIIRRLLDLPSSRS